jgi:hypothetical protein
MHLIYIGVQAQGLQECQCCNNTAAHHLCILQAFDNATSKIALSHVSLTVVQECAILHSLTLAPLLHLHTPVTYCVGACPVRVIIHNYRSSPCWCTSIEKLLTVTHLNSLNMLHVLVKTCYVMLFNDLQADAGKNSGTQRMERDRMRTAILDEASVVCSTLSFAGSNTFAKLTRK